MVNTHKYKADLTALIAQGEGIRSEIARCVTHGNNIDLSITSILHNTYQSWYTVSCVTIKQIFPDRLAEFEQLYLGDDNRAQIDITNISIQDWLKGVRISSNKRDGITGDLAAVNVRLRLQFNILKSLDALIDSSLYDIRQLVQADLFDSEIDAAKELERKGFLRAAGIVVGVVLEKHLAQVADQRDIKICKNDPTIGDFCELLKSGGVLDVPSWRQVQRLGDIRNLCGHNKERKPTSEEVKELIDGVDKCVKTLF